MKPAVINSNSETPIQSHHEPNNPQANNGQPSNDNTRRFPQFRQHGFGFDDPDSDVFADMGLRSRLNRMGNPFDWSGRKRHGAGQGNNDAYDHYFDDVDFPHFGSTWDAFGRMGKRHPTDANDRSGFFNYVPQEFRQYVPEHFGGYFRQHSGQSPYMQQQPTPTPPPPPQSSQQQHPQQHAPPSTAHVGVQQQQQTQPQSSQPSASKSNLCDAAIQTDDPIIHNNNDCDNRNGMKQGNETHMPGGNNQNQYYQQSSPNYGVGQQVPSPQYGRQYQQPYAQQYPQPQPQQQNRNYAHPSTAPSPSSTAQQQQQHPKHTPQEGYVRNVPIVFETTGTPINRPADTRSRPQQSSPPTPPSSPPSQQTGVTKPRPEPLNKESFASNQPIPCPPPPAPSAPSANQQPQQQPQLDQQQHSDPSNADDGAPPQTPHTADCISKIQAIQRDVLELMLAVEQFGGKRGDRDYIYLDEMLTRNLLKLDTIDTNGKDSIRMARKEAIKCIQTSIAVLEAKADLHLNEKRDSVDQSTQNQATESGSDATETEVQPATAETAPVAADAIQQTSAKKMDIEESNASTVTTSSGDGKVAEGNGSGGTESHASDAIEFPKVEEISIDDKPSNDTEKSAQDEPNENKSKDKSNKNKIKEKTPEIVDAK